MDTSKDNIKYSYSGSMDTLTKEDVVQFVDGFKNGKLPVYYKSEVIPEQKDDERVRVLVGDNYQQFLKDNIDNEVWVKFYGPWCGYSKKLEPVWIQLAEELKDIPNLIFA